MNIIVNTYGAGLGDTICTEPIVRYMCKPCYKNIVKVATPFPRIFSHLPVDIIENTQYQFGYNIFYITPIFQTKRGLEINPITKYAQPFFIHPVDFQSLYIMRRILDDGEKRPCIPVYDEELQKLNELVSFDDFIAINISSTDYFRYFPDDFYNDLINRLLLKGYKVVTFGVTERHYTNPQITHENFINLLDKTDLNVLIALISKAKCLITHDSAPLHIAGAFDNGIVLLNTVKSADKILHIRNGNRHYKTEVVQKKLWSDEDEYNINDVILLLDPSKYDNKEFIPDINDIMYAVEKLYKKDSVQIEKDIVK